MLSAPWLPLGRVVFVYDIPIRWLAATGWVHDIPIRWLAAIGWVHDTTLPVVFNPIRHFTTRTTTGAPSVNCTRSQYTPEAKVPGKGQETAAAPSGMH